MAKPFKSEFDLMAEAYATVKYDKQQVINEDKAGRRVIGYPPQVIKEDVNNKIHQDASNGMEKAELEQAYGPEAVKAYIRWGHANDVFEGEPFEDAENTIWDMDVYTQEQEEPIRVKSSSESEVEAEFAAKGLTVTQILYPEPAFSDGSDSPDNEQYPEISDEDRDADPYRHAGMTATEAEDRDADPYRHENAENPIHARLDGMIDQDLLVVAQNALQDILDDLHRHGEDFDGAEVGGFVGKFLG